MPRRIATHVVTDLRGLEALQKLAQQRAAATKAVRAGAKIVQKAAKPRAPKRKGSGALRTSIGLKAQKGKRVKTLAFAVIGARTKVVRMFKGRMIKPSKYAHLVEKGTKAHTVGKRKHPGAKAKPFLAPALRSSEAAVSAEMMRVLQQEIAKALAKQALKAK